MSIVTPNSDLWLCRTKLSPDMKHSVKFATLQEQETYFTTSAAVARVDGGDYVFIASQKENYVRVGINADQIHDVNYIAYRNTTHSNKIFYAFVKEIRYLSANSAGIYFEIDPWQTWQFNLTFNPSYILRETPEHDVPGDNILDEGIEIGDYFEDTVNSFGANELCIAVSTTTLAAPTTIDPYTGEYQITVEDGNVYYNSYSGATLVWFKLDSYGVTALNNFLKALTEKAKEEAVTSIFMAPQKLMSASGVWYETLTQNKVPSKYENYIGKINPPSIPVNLNGYEPKNKKLFTYPYMGLYVYNNLGDVQDYPLENFWWDTQNPLQFEIHGSANGSPEMTIFPKNYKDRVKNLEDSMTIRGYPMCNWQYDAFKGWLAKSAIGTAISLGGSIGSIAAGATTGNPALIAGGITGVATAATSIFNASRQPRVTRGSQANATSVITAELADFYVGWKTIRYQHAQIIDSYFSMYGYKVNRLGTPDFFKTRPYWYYCQMNECNITGFIPPEDLIKIKKAFETGFTLWKNPGDIQNYTLDNEVDKTAVPIPHNTAPVIPNMSGDFLIFI